jgi:hypothetical protein
LASTVAVTSAEDLLSTVATNLGSSGSIDRSLNSSDVGRVATPLASSTSRNTVRLKVRSGKAVL